MLTSLANSLNFLNIMLYFVSLNQTCGILIIQLKPLSSCANWTSGSKSKLHKTFQGTKWKPPQISIQFPSVYFPFLLISQCFHCCKATGVALVTAEPLFRILDAVGCWREDETCEVRVWYPPLNLTHNTHLILRKQLVMCQDQLQKNWTSSAQQ